MGRLTEILVSWVLGVDADLVAPEREECPACGLLTLVRRPLPDATGPPFAQAA